MLLALFASAHATCAIDQVAEGDQVHVRVKAVEEPLTCRTITLSADGPITVAGVLWSPEERTKKLGADHLRPLPGGGWEIGVPELLVGGSLGLDLTVAGANLEVRFGPAPLRLPVVRRADEVRTFELDPKHPGWGFADPKKGRTKVEVTVEPDPAAPDQIWPLPEGAEAVDAGGLPLVPLGVKLGGERAVIRYEVAGAEPQGRRAMVPGTLSLRGPDVRWSVVGGQGVTATADGEARFDAPAGGVAGWRVLGVGKDAVIPDAETFVAGLAWRFAQASLPEPAVPMELRGDRDREHLLAGILSVVQGLRRGALPGADPLHPRPLNAAWRSEWATAVEQGLILHRMLGQERFRPGWVLTGDNPDLATLTGFDTALVTVRMDGEVRWIDPGCTVCAVGELPTRWAGHPAVGIDVTSAGDDPRPNAGLAPYTTEVPVAAGRLTRSMALVGDRFHVRFHAVGAAALWLREALVGVDPALRPQRLADVLGMPDATLVSATGLPDAGAPVTLELEGGRAPGDPACGEDPPWSGGWGDVLE